MGLAETAEMLVRIGLEDRLSSGLGRINGNLGKFNSGIGRTGKGIGQLSGGLVKAGVVLAGSVATGLGFAAKTAIEFDDAFAAVRKTVEASGPELDALNSELHALATRIPIKYTDLADIAAEAGALGVPTQSIAKFTETVARLSASTQGLTVQAAAEAFGKFRNTLKLADADLTRAASSLIALGNAGASSEGDIIEVAKRFGAAGHQAGLSAAQVLGFSSAIASLGVEPEAAGSSLSRLFNNITKYIGTGDKKIASFAKTTGLSIAAFSKYFAKDATGAVEAFLTGLSKMDRFHAANALKKAGINNVRDINAVLLLSQNVGELKRQVDLSSGAFAKNTDLADVSAKRFDTLKNKITVLRNGFLEAGYNIAEGFLPALGRAVDKLTTFLALPSNKSELKALGEDLGKTLDKIDFGKMLDAAKGAVKVLSPMVDALLLLVKALDALPTQVKGAGAALIVANKVSGGAIFGGIGNIIGGLAQTFARSLASKIPLFGSAFVQPVFVTNMGMGGLGGGAGLAGKAAGALGIGAGTLLAGLGITVVAAAAVIAAQQIISGQNSAFAAKIQSGLAPNIASKTPAEIQAALNGVQQGIKDLQSNPLNVLVQGDALTTLQQMERDLIERKNNTELQGHNVSERTDKLKSPADVFKGLSRIGIDLEAIHKAQVSNLAATGRVDADNRHSGGVTATAITHLAADTRRGVSVTASRLTHVAADTRHAGSVTAARLGTSNAHLRAIQAKRTSFTSKTNVNVYTAVNVNDLTRAQAYRTRVSRTTSLSVGGDNYSNNPGK